MKVPIASLLILSAILGGCATQGTNPPTATFMKNHAKLQYGVVLQATNHSLIVKTPPKGWENSGKKYGYVGFAKGESGLVIFGIKGEDVGKLCSDNTDGRVKWVITRIELSATGDPVSEKGNNFGVSQAAYPWLKEAFPGVDLSNGRVYPSEGLPDVDKNGGRTSAAIFSANEQVGDTFAFYRVTAAPCGDGDPVQTDPGIRNGGR